MDQNEKIPPSSSFTKSHNSNYFLVLLIPNVIFQNSNFFPKLLLGVRRLPRPWVFEIFFFLFWRDKQKAHAQNCHCQKSIHPCHGHSHTITTTAIVIVTIFTIVAISLKQQQVVESPPFPPIQRRSSACAEKNSCTNSHSIAYRYLITYTAIYILHTFAYADIHTLLGKAVRFLTFFSVKACRVFNTISNTVSSCNVFASLLFLFLSTFRSCL